MAYRLWQDYYFAIRPIYILWKHLPLSSWVIVNFCAQILFLYICNLYKYLGLFFKFALIILFAITFLSLNSTLKRLCREIPLNLAFGAADNHMLNIWDGQSWLLLHFLLLLTVSQTCDNLVSFSMSLEDLYDCWKISLYSTNII